LTARYGDGSERRGILLVGNFLSASGCNPGPSEELAARLAARGWEVLTASSRRNRPRRLADMLATAWRGRRRYAVAHVELYSGAAFLWAEAVAGLLRVAAKPYILSLHGGNLPAFARRHPRRVRALLGAAAAVTTPSRFLQEAMRSYRSDLLLMPNPIDVAVYEYRLRRRVGPLLVWLRAFHRVYHPELAVAVTDRLAREYPGVRLAMFGPDEGDGSLAEARQAAGRLGAAGRVTFAGAVPKRRVPEVLREHDIFLNTSNVDNAPVSVVEAMACGLCVVSTDAGGMRYLVEQEREALLAPANDAEALAGAVRRVLGEPGLAERLSRAGRAKAEEFDWSRALPRWQELLGSVARA
jgi:glycosyltransferase involved in cell wall biosynthesis